MGAYLPHGPFSASSFSTIASGDHSCSPSITPLHIGMSAHDTRPIGVNNGHWKAILVPHESKWLGKEGNVVTTVLGQRGIEQTNKCKESWIMVVWALHEEWTWGSWMQRRPSYGFHHLLGYSRVWHAHWITMYRSSRGPFRMRLGSSGTQLWTPPTSKQPQEVTWEEFRAKFDEKNFHPIVRKRLNSEH